MELREHWKNKRSNNSGLYVSVNDIVLLMDDKIPRSKWRIGRIVDIIYGNDGKVRAAIVRTKTDTGRMSNLRRPVNKLIPIEEHVHSIDNDKDGIAFVDDTSVTRIDQNS